MSKFMIKSAALILTVLIVLPVNISCSRVTAPPAQTISYNLGAEPETIDPLLNTGVDGANIILACFEGLMRLDKNNKAIPGIASSFTKNSDVKYTFKLRDAKWSDGKQVTARDFEYAWKRGLAPQTGAEYAYQLYYIKGGEAYNKKRAGAESLGINVIDDMTIEVTLEAPTPYFLELLALPTYMPVRQDIITTNPEKWASTPVTYIGNGPFKLTAWRPKDAMEFVKNTNYYDSGRVKLDKLVFEMVEEANTYLTAWESGTIDIIESPPSAEVSRLKSQGKLTVNPYLGDYFYTFNNNVKPLDDKRVRKALTYAIDRPTIIQNVTKNEALPAGAFVPKGIPEGYDASKDFRDVGGEYFKPEGDVSAAQKLLADAGYPGGNNFPKLTLLYNNTGSHAAVAQAIQDMWKRNLGININLQVQEWKDLQKSRANGNFQIARHGWLADYDDPMTFIDLFESSGGNNDANYNNPAYDNLVSAAKKESDPAKRSKLMHDAEAILMDDMPILPIYFYTNLMCIKPYVKDVYISPLGFIYFDRAYVEGKK